MINLYIYYRVAPERAAGIEARVRRMQDELRLAFGVRAELLKGVDQPETWMEVYEGIGDRSAFVQALADAVQNAGLAELKRNTEAFAAA